MVASELLRPGLLEGVSALLAGAPDAAGPGARWAPCVRDALRELGAVVWECAPEAGASPEAEEAAIDEAVERVLGETASIELLVVDGAGLFASAAARSGADGRSAGRAALVGCLEATWNVTRAVVNRAFLAAESSPPSSRIVYLAPAADAGEHAGAACAGLENLARTLSIEWARHAITVVAVAPGESTTGEEVAALTAYLASPAGAYFSGCLLDLSRSSRRTDRR